MNICFEFISFKFVFYTNSCFIGKTIRKLNFIFKWKSEGFIKRSPKLRGDMKLKKLIVGFLMVALVLVLAACSGSNNEGSSGTNSGSKDNAGASSGDKGLAGVSMPTKSSERWVSDGASMVKEFEGLGYKVDLQYAEDVIENQVAQIENMITKGVKILVIAPIDGESLTDVLEKANAEGIKVISYDRLIKG